MKKSGYGKNSVKDFRRLVYPALMAALTGLGAYVIIPLPFSPVPVTFQNLFVLLSGMMLGVRNGTVSQLLYLFLGIAGLPVFAGGTAGPGVLASPTGGFLLAFPVAAFLIGYLSGGRLYKSVLAGGAGLAVIYISGALNMIIFWEFAPGQAILAGVLPFLPGDIFKLAVAAALISSLPQYMLDKLRAKRI